VIIEERLSAKVAAVQLWIKTGSHDKRTFYRVILLADDRATVVVLQPPASPAP
jgi:hypothetical protein